MIGFKIKDSSGVGAEPGFCCDWCTLVVIIFGVGWDLFQGGASTSYTQQFCTINLKFVTGFHVPGKDFATSGKHRQQFLSKVALHLMATVVCQYFCVKHLNWIIRCTFKIACESKYDPGSINKQILKKKKITKHHALYLLFLWCFVEVLLRAQNVFIDVPGYAEFIQPWPGVAGR